MLGIPTALHIFICLPESRVNLPGLERLQDNPPFVVESCLLLADQREGFTQGTQLQILAVTTDHHPPPSVEDKLHRGRVVVLQPGL